MTIPLDRIPSDVLLHRDHYSPGELADLIGIGEHVILHDARTGYLRAYIIDHHILDIRRADAIDWLQRRHLAVQNVYHREITHA